MGGRGRGGPSRPWAESHREALAAGAAALGQALSEAQLDHFEYCWRELVEWNQRFNLTAITDPDDVVDKHFLDSLACALAFPPDGRESLTLIDIGSGAGFPGLPLKLALPGLRLTLLEAVGKKARFLTHLVETLGLTDTTVVVGRAETLGHDPKYRERFDLAVSRAVAELAELVEYCLPFVCLGGRLVVPKKTSIETEMEAAGTAIATLGGRLLSSVLLPDPTRQLVVVEKVAPTPPTYPRREGIPARRPLGARRT